MQLCSGHNPWPVSHQAGKQLKGLSLHRDREACSKQLASIVVKKERSKLEYQTRCHCLPHTARLLSPRRAAAPISETAASISPRARTALDLLALASRPVPARNRATL